MQCIRAVQSRRAAPDVSMDTLCTPGLHVEDVQSSTDMAMLIMMPDMLMTTRACTATFTESC